LGTYHPGTFQGLNYSQSCVGFADGSDSPRAFLERCLETIHAAEPEIQAFVIWQESAAQAAADASAARWQAGQPLSAIDGMPIGIKDLLETKDMPTEMGCAAYKGHFPKNDNAMVWALRQAGAIILGKTVTAELGGAHPGATTNPFDVTRTPGGSSSGSAAAVAAKMLPVAIGSQVGGSIIRPAGYCGNFALKPSQGALNRGERQTTSMSTHGPHAGSLEDMWQVAIEVASRVGGDPGYPGLSGPMTPPAPVRPERLIFIETEGWATLDDASKQAMEALLAAFEQAGGKILRRHDDPRIEQFEQAIGEAKRLANAITAFENRWGHRNLVDRAVEGVSARLLQTLANAEAMSPADYQDCLRQRAEVRRRFVACAELADAMITLSCPGPAPVWQGDVPGQRLAPRPTGDPLFNFATSLTGSPCVSVPMLAVAGMPVGVQLIGQLNADAQMTAFARWMHQNMTPVSVSAR
jgi:Asp-tRNA(Asn)/Glu-tRNA(Gln) amidotransferase A subunit family amidase